VVAARSHQVHPQPGRAQQRSIDAATGSSLLVRDPTRITVALLVDTFLVLLVKAYRRNFCSSFGALNARFKSGLIPSKKHQAAPAVLQSSAALCCSRNNNAGAHLLPMLSGV
jgi:hypothetical protein